MRKPERYNVPSFGEFYAEWSKYPVSRPEVPIRGALPGLGVGLELRASWRGHDLLGRSDAHDAAEAKAHFNLQLERAQRIELNKLKTKA